MNIQKTHIYLIIGLVVSGVVLYLIFSNPDIVSWFDGIGTAMYDFVINNPVSAYFGAFVISTFGNFTIFLPIPYALAVFLLGAQPFIDPLILALICGVGAGIGEVSAYLIGLGGRNFIERKYSKQLNSMKVLIEKYGFWAIALFAATPLPDDTLLIPLGVLKYSFVKTIFAAILGKIGLCLLLAYGGRLGWGFVELIFLGGGAIGTVIGILGTVVLLYVFLKIDWSKVLDSKPIDTTEVNRESKNEKEKETTIEEESTPENDGNVN
ncbi:MAG: YqaA family protein [Candidatus Odinarchaeia archaeon]